MSKEVYNYELGVTPDEAFRQIDTAYGYEHSPEGGAAGTNGATVHAVELRRNGAHSLSAQERLAKDLAGIVTASYRPDWQNDANCRGLGPDRFFSEGGNENVDAKAVCKECVVIEDCLNYAIENRVEYGIWGGESERERRRIRKRRAEAS